MPIFLDTRGKTTLAIGVCDRCNEKFSLMDLYEDPNSPGLRVCLEDRDHFDPWRLPPRQTENITPPFTRPDINVSLDPGGDPAAEFGQNATETNHEVGP